ncbi:sugar ABC transporter permease [Kineosporia sp. J2-2]|uniref:Sugar ABC transporter permease n=1 Tax=Kineosporia corallincola TaxID=2835133 RepID=A0ABS5TBY4_9ACTN|nr:sugar ABC transporter permease [Kineosporia corallincola]MBT0768589.1 sugar ABC transporter permease [Kineosporia corallincola]
MSVPVGSQVENPRPASPSPVPQRPAPRNDPAAWRQKFPGLALPGLVWYAIFTVGPVVAMFVIAFLRWPGMLVDPGFAGFGNFRDVFADPVFWDALRNSAVQIAVGLPVMIVLAFLLAFYVVRKPRGHQVLRFMLFVPALISAPATALMFYSLLNPDGLVNGVLETLGMSGRAWLADEATALPSLIVIDLWAGIGYSAVLLASRLDSVDEEVVQAAMIDGAGNGRLAWGIYWPIARDFIGVVAMLQFLSILFSSAQNVLLLTKGGPGTSTTTLSYLIYQKAFVDADLGYSQAVGIVLFVLGLAGMFAIRRLLRPTH